jgi:uncharacterized protein YkwD
MWGLALSSAAASAQELPCKLDDALSQAAADLLLAQTQLGAQQLTAAVRAAGSDAIGLHAIAVKAGDRASLNAWLAELRARADAELACGQADNESGRLLIATALGGSLSPIDAHKRVVRGHLSVGFDRAELVIAAADGSLTRLGASAEVLARGIALSPELPTPIEVQLVAHGPAGPRPIAERVILNAAASSADDARPDAAPVASASGVDRDDLASLLIDLRRSRGRTSLRDNRLLREAATSHARSVCREGRVAHELAKGQGPEARLASVGLTARLLGETIARAADASSALHALEQSPSHLLTLLEPRFTDVGVGSASDGRGKSCFVVLLCAWPRYMGH